MAKGKTTKTEKTYDNTNRGALFVNDKDGNEKRPDYTGKLSIRVEDFQPDDDGNVLIYLSAWTKEIQNGERAGETLISIVANPPKE